LDLGDINAGNQINVAQMGKTYYLEEDYGSAFDYFVKAAGLGDVHAHYRLSVMYRKGEGVEKDEKEIIWKGLQLLATPQQGMISGVLR
jgi:TPR repeat protein